MEKVEGRHARAETIYFLEVEMEAVKNRLNKPEGVPLVEAVQREHGGRGGRLNPPWVEWLLGWPIGWTACAPLAMDRFRPVRCSPGEYFRAWMVMFKLSGNRDTLPDN